MILLALGSIQYMINRSAMHPADGPNVMRVLAIQAASGNFEVQLRVLQCNLLLATSPSCEMTEDLLSQALSVCFSLSAARNSTVQNAATATVKQIISLLFDRVHAAQSAQSAQAVQAALAEGGAASSDGGADGAAAEGDDGINKTSQCAYLVFQDLCVLSRGEQGVWLKRTSVPPSMGLGVL